MTEKTTVWYDEQHHVIRTVYASSDDLEGSLRVMAEMKRLIEETGCRRVLVEVLGSPGHQSRENRQKFAEGMRAANIEREALVCRSPVLRVLAKAVHLASKNDFPMKFFKTEEQALAWLKEP